MPASTTASPVIYDIAVIGGGINGCGIARDAAGRGMKVILAEQGDLAQGTSSASTKLIHGGLRYLEHYEFRLVRESLTEREVLMKNAPHIIWPLRFILPHHRELRPAWFLRLGLFMYDHLGGRKLLPATKTLDLRNSVFGQPLTDNFKKGFEYSDCWVDDARMVVLNALDAVTKGATVLTRTRCTGAQRVDGIWQITLHSSDPQKDQATQANQTDQTIYAKTLVNAAGPWVDQLLTDIQQLQGKQRNVRLVRGSHVVVPKIYEHDRAYIFQNGDGRIMFAIPYEQDFTLLGTTDRDHGGQPGEVKIADDEVSYICESASVYFKQPIKPADVVWTYSGVRPLYDDGASAAQEATRDYVLKVSDLDGKAPLLNIFGGKITTYRRLAEDALQKLQPYLPAMGKQWTVKASLPGGDFPVDGVVVLTEKLQKDYHFIDSAWAHSLIRRYGTRAWAVLGDAQTAADMGKAFGATLTEREVRFLQTEEWAVSADDILWRRSKLGLHMTVTQRAGLADWLATRQQQTTA